MTATVTLYDLANARDILDEWFLEHEGEVTPELEALLQGLDGQIDEKIERVALYVQEQAANAKALRNHPIVTEADRIRALAITRENRAKGLKDGYLLPLMKRLEKSKINGIAAMIYLANNSQDSVELSSKTEHGEAGTDIAQARLWELSRSKVFADLVKATTTYAINRERAIELSKTDEGKQQLALAGIVVERHQHVRIK